jgi:hypothetical protein
MLAHLVRDAPLVPALAEVFGLPRYLVALREALVADWEASADRVATVRPAVGHAVQFTTWHSLTQEQGLADDDAAALMAGFVIGTARAGGVPSAASW